MSVIFAGNSAAVRISGQFARRELAVYIAAVHFEKPYLCLADRDHERNFRQDF